LKIDAIGLLLRKFETKLILSHNKYKN